MRAKVVLALVLATLPVGAEASSVSFSFTGAPQSWTVPAGVSQATFEVLGAQGRFGGRGAQVVATTAVTSGETYAIHVGGQGGTGPLGGGFNGGAAGGGSSGGFGGGGASDVRRGPDFALADRVLIAAGGGGRGGPGFQYLDSTGIQTDFAGGAGGNSGAPGVYGAGPPGEIGQGGQSGTATAGGLGASSGQLGVGGAGSAGEILAGHGGGGGGGLYGDGGGYGGGYFDCCTPVQQYVGAAGGGGGGSSAIAPEATGTITNGVREGDGLVTVTYEVQPDATTGAASDVDDTGAILAGTVTPNAEATTYHFELGPTASYGQATAETSAGNGSAAVPVLTPVSDLTAGTTYHYRLVATRCGGCAEGTTAGADATFTTLGGSNGGGGGGGPAAGVGFGIKLAIVKPGKLLTLVASGGFPLPTNDPTASGASLAVAGTTGGRTYDLPPDCWKAVRKGFNCKSEPCRVSLLVKKKARVLTATCKGDTGDLGPLPEPGPVNFVFTLGAARYCAACGGTSKGNDTRVWKRTQCSAPPVCP